MASYPDAVAADPVLTRLVEKDRVPWYKKPNLRALYALMIPVCMGVEWATGFDMAMMVGIQTVENWNTSFGYPRGARLGFVVAAYAMGGFFVVPFIPVVGDRWGRKVSIIFGCLIVVVGAIIQAAAQNFEMFVLGRIVLGMGIPFSAVGASSLIGELAYPKERPILTSLFTTCVFVGAIAAAGCTLGTFSINNSWSWRIPSAIQLVPTAPQLIFIWWMPESPRWLISKGRDAEALAILVKYHAEGDSNSKFVKAEFAQIQETIKLEKENQKLTWRQYFTTAANRRRALITLCISVFSQSSGSTPIYLYLIKALNQVGVTNAHDQNAFNMGMSCWALLNAVVSSLLVNKIRRRTMFLTSIIGMLIVFIIMTISAARYAETGAKGAGTMTLVAMVLFSPFYNMSFIVLPYTYLVEIFPFTIRTKGLSMYAFLIRGSNTLNSIVNPIGMDSLKWKLYILYCVWILFEALCIYFLFPETSGRTLEELTFMFEGQEAGQEASQEVQKRIDYILGPSPSSDIEKVVEEPKRVYDQVENV